MSLHSDVNSPSLALDPLDMAYNSSAVLHLQTNQQHTLDMLIDPSLHLLFPTHRGHNQSCPLEKTVLLGIGHKTLIGLEKISLYRTAHSLDCPLGFAWYLYMVSIFQPDTSVGAQLQVIVTNRYGHG